MLIRNHFMPEVAGTPSTFSSLASRDRTLPVPVSHIDIDSWGVDHLLSIIPSLYDLSCSFRETPANKGVGEGGPP